MYREKILQNGASYWTSIEQLDNDVADLIIFRNLTAERKPNGVGTDIALILCLVDGTKVHGHIHIINDQGVMGNVWTTGVKGQNEENKVLSEAEKTNMDLLVKGMNDFPSSLDIMNEMRDGDLRVDEENKPALQKSNNMRYTLKSGLTFAVAKDKRLLNIGLYNNKIYASELAKKHTESNKISEAAESLWEKAQNKNGWN